MEIKSYHDLLENSAKHDFLTNTCNRRGLAESFENLITIKGTKTPISFIICDIDNFKSFNDTYGHTAGDRILVEIADIMRTNVSEKDAVCRWGGEEILLLLSVTTGFRSAKEIIANYAFVPDYKLCITKVDEVKAWGGVMNISFLAKKPIAYLTIGQNVPDDIKTVDAEEIADSILGRR
jgi:GGDEF domain-containing protein